MTLRRQNSTVSSSAAPATIRRHRPDYQIILYMGVLVLLGLVVLYAISPARVEMINQSGHDLNQAHFMQKQLLYLTIGLSGFMIAASLPIEIWQRNAAKLLLTGIGACLLLSLLGLVPALHDKVVIAAGGAVRWYNLGVASFQPAELLKFGLMLFVAGFLGRRMRQGRISSIPDTLVPLGVLVAVASLLIIVFQKDMGTGITLFGMLLSMLVIAGIRAWRLSLAVIGTLMVGGLLIATSPHRVERVMTFLNPASNDPSSYHITQAAVALGSGGILGKGLGNSVQAFGYLPEAVNDSIFAILGETFGFVGVVCILILFYMLMLRILKVIDRVEDATMKLIAAGVFGLIATHVLVNIGAMTGVFPLTGVTLPFLSFGGTSLLFMMIGLGMVLHISRYTRHGDISDRKESSNASAVRRRGIGRSRYASSRRYQRTS